MAGGKGKSTGGKAGPKEAAGKTQKSHSAKAGLQVNLSLLIPKHDPWSSRARTRRKHQQRKKGTYNDHDGLATMSHAPVDSKRLWSYHLELMKIPYIRSGGEALDDFYFRCCLQSLGGLYTADPCMTFSSPAVVSSVS